MKRSHPPLRISRVAVFPVCVGLLIGNAAAQDVERSDRTMDPDKARAVEYWNHDRRQQARPRDLVIDPRGLGYLRRADGSLEPYGHQISAASAGPIPAARPASSDDSTPPSIGNMDPDGATIGQSATFSATVTDAESGVRSVSFIITYPDGVTAQTFSANAGANDVWSVDLQGFTDGNWSWVVLARDNAKRGGNEAKSNSAAFTVATGGSAGDGGSGAGNGGASHIVTNAEWTEGGSVQTAAGRIYFEMPTNARRKGPWGGYVCSGTVVTETTTGRSLILTAAHCVYDDANKAYARNVLFIPDQAHTSGSGTDTNCNNDPLGCWVPSFGVVDVEWTTRTFPNNIAWDYAYYVVDDQGAHSGAAVIPEALDNAVPTLAINFATPYTNDSDPSATSVDFTHALGYSYSEDPKFMYCAEDMTAEGSVNWWLPSCGLSGGASGGPWVQSATPGSGPIISVNSWGYSNSPGMAGPKLDVSSAECVKVIAESPDWLPASTADGEAGIEVSC